MGLHNSLWPFLFSGNDLHVSLGGAVSNCLLPEDQVIFAIFSEAGFENITFEDVPQRYLLTARKV